MATIGSYQLGNEIGRGAFAIVYQALDTKIGEFVAIKQIQLSKIKKDELTQVMGEVELLSNLSHENIVQYITYVKTDDELNIVLEYVENGSLLHVLKKFGKFPESLTQVYMNQVLLGLIYLHDQGVIHRDIKAANLLTTKTGTIKLTDFGVSTLASDNSETGTVVGTPYWMAPEIIELNGATTKSDIWSLGCTVIELLTGTPPYFELSQMPALFRIVQDDFPPMPDTISPSLKDFLMQCFQKDPLLRISAQKLISHRWIKPKKTQVSNNNTPAKPTNNNNNNNNITNNSNPTTPSNSSQNLSSSNLQKESKSRSELALELNIEPEALSPVKLENRFNFSTTKNTNNNNNNNNNKKKDSDSESESLDWDIDENDDEGFTSKKIDNTLVLDSFVQEDEDDNNFDLDFGDLDDLDFPSFDDDDDDDQEKDENQRMSISTPQNVIGRGSNLGLDLNPSIPIPHFQGLEGLDLDIDDDEDWDNDFDENRFPDLNEGQKETQTDFHKKLADFDQKMKQEKIQRKMSLNTSKDHGVSALKSFSGNDNQDQDDWDDVGFSTLKLKQPAARIDVSQIEVDFSTITEDSNNDDDDDDWNDDFAAKLKNKMQNQLIGGNNNNNNNSSSFDDIDGFGSDSDDPFGDSFDDDDDLDEYQNSTKDKEARMSSEILKYVELLYPEQKQEIVINTCEELIQIFRENLNLTQNLIRQHVVIPIMEMLEVNNLKILRAVLKVINQIIQVVNQNQNQSISKNQNSNSNMEIQETICLVGGIPAIMKFSGRNYSSAIRLETATFVKNMCSTSTKTLQMFIAARGLPVLVDFLQTPYSKSKDLVWMAIDGIWSVFELQTPTPKNDFCRLFVKCDVLSGLGQALQHTNSDPEAKNIYPLKIANIFLFFSSADGVVKKNMCQPKVLKRIISVFSRLNVTVLSKMLKAIKNLSMDSNVLDYLQSCGTIQKLVPLLGTTIQKLQNTSNNNKDSTKISSTTISSSSSSTSSSSSSISFSEGSINDPNLIMEGSILNEMTNQLLNTMYNLNKLNKKRQEESSKNGIIPHLQYIIKTNNPLKQFALPIICDLGHNKGARPDLWNSKGVEFYLDLLTQEYWQENALDSLSVWLNDETQKVEQIISQKQNISKLVSLFSSSQNISFVNLGTPFLKILTISLKITLALLESQFVMKLLQKLSHPLPLVRVNLLKILNVLYDGELSKNDNKSATKMRSECKTVLQQLQNDKAILVKDLAKKLQLRMEK